MTKNATSPGNSGRVRQVAPLLVAFLAFIMIGSNDGALGVLLPNIQSHYGIDKAIVSLAFLTSTGGYFIASFCNGPLVERLGGRFALFAGAGLFLLSAGALGLAPPFPALLCAYLGLGMGIAIVDAGMNAYVASLPRGGALLNYLHAFYGAGAWLGPIVASGIFALQWSWNVVYLLWSGLGLLVLLCLLFAFREQHLPRPQRVEGEPPQGSVLGATLRLRVVWLAALFLLFYVGTEVSLGNWSYSFLTQTRFILPLAAGWMVSGYWLGLTLGRVVLGHFVSRLGEKRLIYGCLAGVALGLVLLWLSPFSWLTAGALWLTGFSLGPLFPTTIALMPRYIIARLQPSASGCLISLGSMGGALFPWLAGNLAQFIGLWTLLPFVMLLTLLMLGMWIALLAAGRRADSPRPPQTESVETGERATGRS